MTVALRRAVLRPPIPRRQLVARDRLLDQLRSGPAGMPPLVLVCAPAGSGKTTLLTQWLVQARPDGDHAGDPGAVRVAWLSLDTSDAGLRPFLTHLVAALQVNSPQLGREALALLEAGPAHPVDVVLSALLDDLHVLTGETVVALDDYHVVDDPEVHAAVAFLLDHLPPHVTVAMTTRADPPLPLARLRARGQLLELRAADLRFTLEEADAFFTDVMALDLAPAQVAVLEARTEGWAAGLQLAALAARGHTAGPAGSASERVTTFVEGFSGSHRFVVDYLLDEVLATQPARIRTFLLDTSVLDHLTGALCDALSGGGDGQQVLQSLEHDNVFLVPLDDERRWFRYHRLFADALRSRTKAEDPARVRGLHRAASDWHAEHGTLPDAVRHALAAGDAEHAAGLVELALPGARRRREDVLLRTWLGALADGVLRAHPLLATQMGSARLSEGDLDGAERWLDVGDAAFRASAVESAPPPPAERLVDATTARDAELRALPAQAAVYRAAVAQGRGDVEGTVLHARRALALAGPDDHVARAGGAGFLGLAAWASGDLATAVDTFEDAVLSLRAAGNLTDELSTTVVLADMWLARGRPVRAQLLYEQALATAGARPGAASSTTGDLHVGLADVLRETGDLDGAQQHLQAALELGERASLPENRYRWFTAASGLMVARGDLDGAVAMLGHAERLHRPGYFPEVRPVPAMRARVRIAQGRLEEAAAWASARRVTAADLAEYTAEHEQLTFARLVVARHTALAQPSLVMDVLALLTRSVIAAEGGGRGGSLVEALMVRALAHRALGDVDAAVADLGRSVRAAVPVGYRRLFLDEGPAVRELLELTAAHGTAEGRGEASTLLRAAGVVGGVAAGTRAGTSSYGPESLSGREAEVLRLLSTDLSGPEIAARLLISLNTFRTHTRNIFTKLDVTTRRAAVSRADRPARE